MKKIDLDTYLFKRSGKAYNHQLEALTFIDPPFPSETPFFSAFPALSALQSLTLGFNKGALTLSDVEAISGQAFWPKLKQLVLNFTWMKPETFQELGQKLPQGLEIFRMIGEGVPLLFLKDLEKLHCLKELEWNPECSSFMVTLNSFQPGEVNFPPSLKTLLLLNQKFDQISSDVLTSLTLPKSLEYLDLSNGRNPIYDFPVNAFNAWVQTWPQSLSGLNLSDCALKGKISSLDLPPTLTYLKIQRNRFVAEDFNALAQKDLPCLQTLVFGANIFSLPPSENHILQMACQFPELRLIEIEDLRHGSDMAFSLPEGFKVWESLSPLGLSPRRLHIAIERN